MLDPRLIDTLFHPQNECSLINVTERAQKLFLSVDLSQGKVSDTAICAAAWDGSILSLVGLDAGRWRDVNRYVRHIRQAVDKLLSAAPRMTLWLVVESDWGWESARLENDLSDHIKSGRVQPINVRGPGLLTGSRFTKELLVIGVSTMLSLNRVRIASNWVCGGDRPKMLAKLRQQLLEAGWENKEDGTRRVKPTHKNTREDDLLIALGLVAYYVTQTELSEVNRVLEKRLQRAKQGDPTTTPLSMTPGAAQSVALAMDTLPMGPRHPHPHHHHRIAPHRQRRQLRK